MPSMLKLHRVMFSLTLGVAVAGILVQLVAGFSTSHAPMTPDPSKGLVVPVNVHGTIAYISHAHDFWLNRTWPVFIPCFLYAWVSIVYPKWRKWRQAGGTKV